LIDGSDVAIPMSRVDVENWADLVLGDGIHPTVLGHRLIANKLENIML
jgi:phospholipase/lecithinase/hemolysin